MLKRLQLFKKNTEKDIELFDLIKKEEQRQEEEIELIASENFTSENVKKCLGSCLTNKYSEGYPDKRYYGGNKYIDQIEKLCISRCLSAFDLNKEKWGVNVQSYSGSIANMSVYLAFLKPGDIISGLNLPDGGHLTHGFGLLNKSISHTSRIFKSVPYGLNNENLIDYDQVKKICEEYSPKILICGYSAYSRDIDYSLFRKYADSCGAILMCDMSHYSGFVATGMMNSPFEYCDIITTTTHKTLRGPRAALIFYKKEYENAINSSVFQGIQGGPNNNKIAGIATQMKEIKTKEYKRYISNVNLNAKLMCKKLSIKYKFNILTGNTDNHIILIDLKNKNISGAEMEFICDKVGITLNKNAVKGDVSPFNPSGIRIGTSAITTKNYSNDDILQVCFYLDICCKLCQKIKNDTSCINLKEFKKNAQEDYNTELTEIKYEITSYLKNRKKFSLKRELSSLLRF